MTSAALKTLIRGDSAMGSYVNNLSVRSKLVLLISAVVFVLLTSVLAVVWVQSRREVRSFIEQDMRARNDAFVAIERYRIRDRALIASLVASRMSESVDPSDEKQTCAFLQRILDFGGTDAKDSAHADYAAFQTQDGKVLGVAVRGHPVCSLEVMKWRLPDVSSAFVGQDALMTNWESHAGTIYAIYVAKVKRGNSQQIVGAVSIGYMQQDEAARLAKARTGTDVVFWHEGEAGSQEFEPHVFGVSDPRLGAALKGKLPESNKGIEFKADGEQYVLQQITLDPPGVQRENPERVHIGLVESVTQRMRPFVTLEHYLAVLGACSLLIGVGLGVIFSRPLVKPLVGLANVARDVENGKYDGIKRLKVENQHAFASHDEIGILCRAFEGMVGGLKELRAMSKFLSHSACDSLGHCDTSVTLVTQRKWMVVLFSDIRDFTAFSEDRDPESVVQRLNQVLGMQAEVVTKQGGDIDKFIGDAMVAWFSGPDRCRRAVEAVREMFAELAAKIGDGAGGQVGVGLHVGEVIVGALGSRQRQDYTAIGSTVNLAARLCSAAKSGQLLISQAVATELGSAVPVRALPPISLKGFAERVAVYEVLFEDSSAPRSAAAA